MEKKILLPLAIAILLLSGCAETVHVKQCLPPEPYGFFGGLWHGIIAPLSFITSLFINGIEMYSVNNTGGWYDFGFVLGAGILFGGGSNASK